MAPSKLINDLKTLLPAMHTTTLFSTHEDREVNALADDKIELSDGRIVAEDRTQTFSTNFSPIISLCLATDIFQQYSGFHFPDAPEPH